MTRKRLPDSEKKNYEELARRLSAAFLSHRLGISYATASKQYVGKKPVGKYWFRLAQSVERAGVAKLESVSRGKSKRKIL